MIAKLFVLAGAPDHESGGETSSPSQVYLVGMLAPSVKADETSLNDIELLPDDCCAVVAGAGAVPVSAAAVVSALEDAPREHAASDTARMVNLAAEVVMGLVSLRGACQRVWGKRRGRSGNGRRTRTRAGIPFGVGTAL